MCRVHPLLEILLAVVMACHAYWLLLWLLKSILIAEVLSVQMRIFVGVLVVQVTVARPS